MIIPLGNDWRWKSSPIAKYQYLTFLDKFCFVHVTTTPSWASIVFPYLYSQVAGLRARKSQSGSASARCPFDLLWVLGVAWGQEEPRKFSLIGFVLEMR